MGLYDSIDYTTDCPWCDAPVSGFQTKSLDSMMANYTLAGAVHRLGVLASLRHGGAEPELRFYTYCGACRGWVEYTVTADLKVVLVGDRPDWFVPVVPVPDDGFVHRWQVRGEPGAKVRDRDRIVVARLASGAVVVQHYCQREHDAIVAAPALQIDSGCHQVGYDTATTAPTVTPSIECLDCGLHGYVIGGVWVDA